MAGLPKTITIASEEIREALMEPVTRIVGAVRQTLEHCLPELAADLIDHGIVLAGLRLAYIHCLAIVETVPIKWNAGCGDHDSEPKTFRERAEQWLNQAEKNLSRGRASSRRLGMPAG